MINKILCYESNSFNPYVNLSIEKYLLDAVDNNTLILYLWQNENTVVIGKNQNPWSECKARELEAGGGYLARRLSGGGAVYHDKGNLNFTFISTTENYDLDRNIEIIRKACLYAGIKTETSGRNDILANGKKFSGNAFYNSKGKTYHHGTILINTDFNRMAEYLTPSNAKLQSKGVKSVKARTVNLSTLSTLATVENFIGFLKKSTEDVTSLKIENINLTDNEQIRCLTEKFSSNKWKYGETLPFSVLLSERFSWGSIEIRLSVHKGYISSCQAFTDSMDETLSEKINEALNGKELKIAAIKESLLKALHKTVANDIISLFNKNEI